MTHIETETLIDGPAPADPAADAAALAWLEDAQKPERLHVRRVPLDALPSWSFDPDTGTLTHRSGRFFSIEGLRVTTNHGAHAAWMQPIIDQSDIGILGLLACVEDGRWQLLVQRKVEPGNVNVAQISPTVQATHSNYTRVHGGTRPAYLEYFLDPPRGAVIVDTLQMEQGARYCGKRNRNMVVAVRRADVTPHPDYRWMTLESLWRMAAHANALNLDTRSVLSCSCIPARAAAVDPAAINGTLAWLAALQRRYWMTANRVPLRSVEDWRLEGDVLSHVTGRYFEVVGISVEAPTREVPRWDQPLVRSVGRGVIGFLCQMRDGALRFLARGALEPGESQVRIGPTLQCIPGNHDAPPPFFDDIVHAPAERVRFRAVQSEEGGRFYHDERTLVAVELPQDAAVDPHPDYRWMTAAELRHMIGQYGTVNIEARALLACLPFGA